MAFADANPRIIKEAWPKNGARVLLAAACKPGDPLRVSTGWRPAINTTATVLKYAVEGGIAGEYVHVADGMVIENFTGGTPGNPLYITSAGAYTETAGTYKCGYMVTATVGIVGASTLPV